MSGMLAKPGSNGWLTLPAGDSGRAWQPYSATARAQPHFEAFRQLEAAGHYEQAFSRLQAGNRIKDEALDGAADVRRQAAAANALRSLFTASFLRDQPATDAAHAPIFIIGMPRSGSTLIEQILGSHPRVQPLGETGDVSAIAARTTPYGGPEGFDPGRMAEQYLGAARARGWDGARRLVDKSLTNHAHVGLIHLMFPKAIILHTVRSAPDTCFSCYRTLFGNDALMAFAYDLETIAARYRVYREVMAHWSFVLMGRVAEVRHERLVADPEAHIRALLATCGLTWDPQCLRFHETERVIDTASAEQVRRPIFGDGVGRWRTYERQLAPLVRALGPYGRST